MTRSDFLKKLRAEGSLEMVEPSVVIHESYMDKAADCLKSAEILIREGLYENSVSMSYYAMYNSLTALLRLSGIKCENHAGCIRLLEEVFKQKELGELM